MTYTFLPLPMPSYGVPLFVIVFCITCITSLIGFYIFTKFERYEFLYDREQFHLNWLGVSAAVWVVISGLCVMIWKPSPPLNKKVVATYVTTTASDYFNRTSGKTPRDKWERSIYVVYKLETGEVVHLRGAPNFAYPQTAYLYVN